MDLATLVGLVGALGIILAAIFLGGDPNSFVDVPSILIVFAGSLFVVMAKFSLGQFLGAVKVAARAFSFKLPSTEDTIAELVEIAGIARKEGVLALESREFSSPFLKKGMQLLIDGQGAETVQELLNKERVLTIGENKLGAKIFRALGDVAPAMGMIGTLVGLVQMLANMSDPAAIGPAMAVALLTTLYGAMIANMFALPMADKLDLRAGDEAQNQALLIDAIMSIQEGRNPRIIEQMLRAYLPTAKRDLPAAEG